MPGREYKVTIKSANQKTSDYVATCESEWTVYKLKQHIAITHINKPPVEEQRLIYAGRLLNDNHILRQIFFRDSICTDQNPDKADFTIHLVCAQPQQASDVLSTSQSNNRRTIIASSTQSPPVNSQTPSSLRHQNLSNQQQADQFLNLVNTDGSQQNILNNNIVNNVFDSTNMNFSASNNTLNMSATIPTNANILAGISFSNGLGTDMRVDNNPYLTNVIHTQNSTLDPQAQQALFQHMAQLVASQLNQFTPGTVPISLSPQTSMGQGYLPTLSFQGHHSVGPQFNVNRFQYNLLRGVPNAQPNVNLDNNNAPNVNVVRDNAPNIDQARPMQQNGDLDIHRQVLDWLYYTFRAIILMTALYVHSSYKFIFFVCVLAFCYLYKKRNANRRAQRQNERREINNNMDREQVLNEQAIHNNDVRGRYENLRHRGAPVLNNDDNIQASPDVSGDSREPIQDVRLPFLKMIYMVVTSFVMSLIPDNQIDNRV